MIATDEYWNTDALRTVDLLHPMHPFGEDPFVAIEKLSIFRIRTASEICLVVSVPWTYFLGVNRESIHVVTNPGGGWAVRKSGATRASKTFKTQNAAIVYGKGAAKKATGELFIHKPNGLIRERNSYGSDPHPPKG